MTYPQLEDLARNMTPEQVQDNLISLAADTRFAAVLAWLQQEREGYIAHGCRQDLSPHHGPLAHCQGSVFALRALETDLRKKLLPKPPAKSLGPEPE